MIHTADKYNLRKNIVFNMKLIKANWHEEQSKWKLQLDSGNSIKYDEADVFIDAKGILKCVSIPGSLLKTDRLNFPATGTGLVSQDFIILKGTYSTAQNGRSIRPLE